MRKELAAKENERSRFTASFVRYGSRQAFKGTTATTLLFASVQDENGRVLCDHVWINSTKEFEKYSFLPGDKVSFYARVTEYSKGYKGISKSLQSSKKDFRLSHPTKVEKL
jgi:hypothetical protein